MLLSKRPKTHIGKTQVIPQSVEEESLRFIAIVTEGSVEELAYLKGYQSSKAPIGRERRIYFLNDYINEEILAEEKTASHPLRRLELMKELLSLKNPDFSSYPDEAWQVCDRDEQSFSCDQYDELLMECDRLNINLIVSNPAFQIWLLFHFDAWLKDALFEDGINSSRRLSIIERRLKFLLPGYQHGHLLFSRFKHRIDTAIANSRRYCTDVYTLKEECGTNFAQLMDSLRCYFSASSEDKAY